MEAAVGPGCSRGNRAERCHTLTTQLAYLALLAEVSAESQWLAAMLPPELRPAAGSECGLGPSSASAELQPKVHNLDCHRMSDNDCGTGLGRVA